MRSILILTGINTLTWLNVMYIKLKYMNHNRYVRLDIMSCQMVFNKIPTTKVTVEHIVENIVRLKKDVRFKDI